MSLELFELELLGGRTQALYRQARPEVEAMPWGTLDPSGFPAPYVDAARRAWTSAAFQEHRTGAACAATLRSLIEARAPLDLIALATRFPLDEIVHVELCSRLAMELGGAVPLTHDPEEMVMPVGEGEQPFLRACHQVVAFFCVGEAISIPLLNATAHYATHPLIKAVLERIVRDEADHGTFGWTFLDWAVPQLEAHDLLALGQTADLAIGGLLDGWASIRSRPLASEELAADLGWMQTAAYLELAERSLDRCVVRPLRQRGIQVTVVDV